MFHKASESKFQLQLRSVKESVGETEIIIIDCNTRTHLDQDTRVMKRANTKERPFLVTEGQLCHASMFASSENFCRTRQSLLPYHEGTDIIDLTTLSPLRLSTGHHHLEARHGF